MYLNELRDIVKRIIIFCIFELPSSAVYWIWPILSLVVLVVTHLMPHMACIPVVATACVTKLQAHYRQAITDLRLAHCRRNLRNQR